MSVSTAPWQLKSAFAPGASAGTPGSSPSMSPDDQRALLHRLNNQLGVILAHAELLEAKAGDAAQRARASQVVNAALQAMAVSREMRESVDAK